MERSFEIQNDVGYRVGVDTGGTFTDLVIVSVGEQRRWTVKVPSTPSRPADAVVAALERSGVAPDIEFFVLGTTVGTNALLQRRGERTVYVTTAGFEDVPFIQRINRLGLYDLQWQKPAPYVRRADCIGVHERIGYDGTVHVLLEDVEIERVIERLRPLEGAIAVNLLFAFANPEHEQRLASAIRSALPDRRISVSSEIAPVWREFERANTVIVDASLKRLVGGFAQELDRGVEATGARCPRFFLKSNGGQVSTRAAARRPIDLMLSGLAGGLIAGKFYADALELDAVVTLDMGGTSADVGLILDRRIRSANVYEFEWGLPLIAPVVDLTTIGAGGSSIASRDSGGLLRVGPESAGAQPGPACYGRGGSEATVTDANVVLGRLNPDYFLGGELPLDADLARAAIETLAAAVGLDREGAAQAVIELAVENMTNAIRLLCADRGIDYRALDLIAFGGAGPLHAALIARRLGLRRVVIPPEPGLASAFGALVADLRVDRRITRSLRSDTSTAGELREALAALAREALGGLHEEGEPVAPVVALSAGCRYVGQNYEQEIAVALDQEGDLLAATLARFHAQHEATYGYQLPEAPMEIVQLTATAIDAGRPPLPGVSVPEHAEPARTTRRPVFFKRDDWVETAVMHRSQLAVGRSLPGPLVIEEPDSTVLVLDGQHVRLDRSGALILEPSADASLQASTHELESSVG